MNGWIVPLLVTGCLLALGLATVRLLKGPTSADRIVALDIFLAASVALCVAASLATARTVFLDVAIGVALVGFVGTVGWARLVDRSADEPEHRTDDKDRP